MKCAKIYEVRYLTVTALGNGGLGMSLASPPYQFLMG